MKIRNRLTGILLAAVIALAVSGAAAEASEALEPGDLIIDPAKLTEEPAFIDWIWEDVPMQLIALKDADGKIRLSFNTCQSCNGSPWAWFEYPGNGLLECQNCLQRVSVLLVGDAEAKGCAPIPVPEFTENEDGTLTVPEHVFAEAAPLFAKWRNTGE